MIAGPHADVWSPPDAPDVRIIDAVVWLRHPDQVFRIAFRGRPGEPAAALYARWRALDIPPDAL